MAAQPGVCITHVDQVLLFPAAATTARRALMSPQSTQRLSPTASPLRLLRLQKDPSPARLWKRRAVKQLFRAMQFSGVTSAGG